MKINGIVTCFSLLCGQTLAYPGGAGSCKAGTDAIQSPGLSHAMNGQVGGTALADRGLSVSLNGETLVPDTVFDFAVGEAHELTIQGTSEDATPFRGFLARIAAENGIDTTSALAAGENDDDVQVAEGVCVAMEKVGGITHKTRSETMSASGILRMEEPAEGLVLDVTVVIRNSAYEDISEWYYSRYLLNAVGQSITPESPSPTTEPVGNETTTPPTVSPTVSVQATNPPTATPTSNTTIPPSSNMTISPSSNTTISPSTLLPVSSPPTSAPTMQPVQETSFPSKAPSDTTVSPTTSLAPSGSMMPTVTGAPSSSFMPTTTLVPSVEPTESATTASPTTAPPSSVPLAPSSGHSLFFSGVVMSLVVLCTIVSI